MSAARPLVTVHSHTDGSAGEQIPLPAVFLSPIRPDIIQFVHTSMAKNKRQAYGVKNHNGPSGIVAGHQHSAHSWGTGRAVSRIPRVSGGGTHRAGQGAFGNMCRSGRMFAPTKIWRKWHRKINTNQRRYATTSALAASALPSLVMARGHRIGGVPEIPLVLDAKVESISKTKEAVEALMVVGAYTDVAKAASTKKVRAGKGKMRNRRHVMRRGPLVVYDADNGIVKAFRNLPGVETCQVGRLNLLQLAPGSHMGRFIVWTQPAFVKLNDIFGTSRKMSLVKKDYRLPRSSMTNTDLVRIINSDEVQSKLRPMQKQTRSYRHKKNPLSNLGVMIKLNPYALTMRRQELVQQEIRKKQREEIIAKKRGLQQQE
uniref:Component of cytosolic 80S ribosome and 60S large subunit n=1 Tax=Hirondellea gigas TaxID=1518452 RepID=A0A6A7FU22_9CRUS